MPDGADMLSYKTPGNYYCTSDARAKTLLNCPVKKAFTLKVDLANGDNYPRQTFATISNVTYSRTYDPYQNLWVDAKTIMTNDEFTVVGIKNISSGVSIKDGTLSLVFKEDDSNFLQLYIDHTMMQFKRRTNGNDQILWSK